jgi:riboflavin synthase
MFTGIIEELGVVKSIVKIGNNAVISISAKKVIDSQLGDSISVNGVCLTVVNINKDKFDADISFETLKRSALNFLKPGMTVNLERAITLNTRLGGHLVLGHVDCVAEISSIVKKGAAYELRVKYDRKVDKFIAEKGSVALDGISLTVSEVKECVLTVAVIPHTFENTNLQYKRVGDMLNLEVDIISRYMDKLLKNQEKGCSLKDDKNHVLEKNIMDMYF